MPMTEYVLLFVCYFVFIGLRAFQQINVQNHQLMLVVPTSLLMAAMEVFVITTLAKQGYGLVLVLVYGVSAGLGSLTAMHIQKWYRARLERKKSAQTSGCSRWSRADPATPAVPVLTIPDESRSHDIPRRQVQEDASPKAQVQAGG